MEGSIKLSSHQHKIALRIYRGGGDARAARRAHVLLLLNEGMSYRQIMDVTFSSSDLVAGVKERFLAGGVEAAVAESPEVSTIPFWQIVICGWVLHQTPQDFGYFRTRWSCEILAELLDQQYGIELSAESIRRGLHALGFAWRRPRPIVGLSDPDYTAKMRRIRRLLATLPADEVAVFQDEVDVHLNPKIGSQWMPVGEQATVETPGNNVKRHVAGSLVWNTGTLLVSPPAARRNAQLFVAHLDDLRRRLRGYRKIHVILDNAPFHDCGPVRDYLQTWGHRIELHYLPKYSPETNPIERVWWHLHETITRNHRCQTIDELLELAYDWFTANNNHFYDMRNTFAAAA
jgi:transposase